MKMSKTQNLLADLNEVWKPAGEFVFSEDDLQMRVILTTDKDILSIKDPNYPDFLREALYKADKFKLGIKNNKTVIELIFQK